MTWIVYADKYDLLTDKQQHQYSMIFGGVKFYELNISQLKEKLAQLDRWFTKWIHENNTGYKLSEDYLLEYDADEVFG